VYVALACGLTPAVCGISIVLLWLWTRYGGLEALGFFNILFGLVCTVVGGIALVIHFWQAIGQGAGRSDRGSLRAWSRGRSSSATSRSASCASVWHT
jgi:hypothetical protein